MKRILFFVIAVFICGNLFSQTPLSYRFRKPTSVNATTWKFSSVAPGIDAIVNIINTKNATVDRIDDSTIYPFAWQPFIRYTNSMSNNSDSSYVEFRISFQNNSNGTPSSQSTLAMTVIDCDGSNTIRELVKVSLPATATVLSGSQLVEWADTSLLNIVSGTTNYSNIDTSIYAAMTQINFTNVSSYTMRIGAVGRVSANSVRQSSFYFKPFTAFNQALPVNLLSFRAKLENNVNAELTWSTTSEEDLNRFEVYRSNDGLNFYPIATVKANNFSSDVMNYSYTDYNIENKGVFYRLKLIDNSGNYKFSHVSLVKLNIPTRPVSVAVYPNPATDYVNIQLNTTDESGSKVEILNAFGKEVQCFINPEISAGNAVMIDVKDLEKGVYIINILNNDGSSTSSKFIKR